MDSRKGSDLPQLKISMISRKREKEPIEIVVINKITPSKERTQYLVMTLESRLNWEEHINLLRAKAKKVLNTIRIVAEKIV